MFRDVYLDECMTLLVEIKDVCDMYAQDEFIHADDYVLAQLSKFKNRFVGDYTALHNTYFSLMEKGSLK